MVDSNGDKIPKQILNKSLTLYENCVNPKDVICFLLDDEYLEKTNMYETLTKFTEDEINQKKELKLFLNGILFKYWSEMTISDILFYRSDESINSRKIQNEKQKNIYEIYRKEHILLNLNFYQKVSMKK